MTFDASEPMFGMMLSPLITAISYNDERAVLTMQFQGGTGNELPWTDAGLAALVARIRGTAGMSVPDLRRAVADIYPGLSDDDIGKTTDAFLRRLTHNDMVRWWFGTAQRPLCFLDPRSRLFYPRFGPEPVPGAVPDGAVLSRFAFMRRDGDTVVLENPEHHAVLTFTKAGQDLVPVAFAGSASGRSSAFWHFLWCSGFLEDGTTDTPSRQAWEFHDRVFHARSRSFLGRDNIGMNYRLKSSFASPPARKPPMSDRKIALPRLRDGEDAPRSRPLNSVMETRHSIRSPGDFPLTLADLGVFLWRTASIRGQMSGGGQELLKRPMPAGGAIHELEFYIAIHRCDGLEPGLYQYHGGDHALYALPTNPPYVQAILAGAAGGMGVTGELPDCVIVMASRLLRLAWKYQGMAYRLSMLHAGVAIETFYLVAEDMGLSPCAVGGGDSALFAIATGLAEDEEAAIGEFVLNGRQVSATADTTSRN